MIYPNSYIDLPLHSYKDLPLKLAMIYPNSYINLPHSGTFLVNFIKDIEVLLGSLSILYRLTDLPKCAETLINTEAQQNHWGQKHVTKVPIFVAIGVKSSSTMGKWM